MNNNLNNNICQKLAYDTKQYHYNTSDNMKRIMQFFSDSKIHDLEKKENLNDDVRFLYSLLGWDTENYFDVMYSFWQIFSYGLIHINPNQYFITNSGNIKNAYKRRNYNYKSYPEKFLSTGERELKNDNSLLQQKFPSITAFAAMTHSVSNFIPVPDNIFNIVKNSCGVGDYLPLMIDKIEYCIEREIPLKYKYKNNTKEVSVEKLQEWKKYFIMNSSRFSLESEFEYNNDTGKMKGNLLFDTQSFDKPFPIESYEYKQCLESTLTHILSRSERMAEKLITS